LLMRVLDFTFGSPIYELSSTAEDLPTVHKDFGSPLGANMTP
jgi:hypothetical protein